MTEALATSAPFSLVLFGASGHLAKQKLYPALYTLALKKRLPAQYAIVGFARTPMDDAAFRTLVEDAVRADMPAVTEVVLQEFLSHCHYHSGQYDKADDFVALDSRLNVLEKNWKTVVRLEYLSVPPDVFPAILRHSCACNLRRDDRVLRCIVEKPVGHDIESADELWEILTDCFAEDDVFLLDHYLGKEAVRNVYYLRFANPVLERLFKNTLIDHVEITASESAGLENRAGYFEGVGALRDMVQSHLLEIASLLTMRVQDDEGFRSARLNALSQFYIPPASSLNAVILQGQYATGMINGKPAKGYREEEGITTTSRTNTFVALKLQTRMSRWEGVPFFLRTGKRLSAKETRVSILFQMPREIGMETTSNRLDIILQGEAGMRLSLQTKLGGTEPRFRPLVLEDPLVCVGDCLPEHGLLLLEAIHGKQQWFLTMDEVRAAWRLIDPLQTHLCDDKTPLALYPSGSLPAEADAWMEKQGKEWLL